MYVSKKIIVVACCTAFVFLGIAAVKPVKGDHENLKVLPKDISNEALDSIMENYKKALGIDCNFCHAKSKKDPNQWDYPNDEKPEKEIARKMMKMVEKINLDFFDYKMIYTSDELLAVTCNTCHHGAPRPELADEKNE